MTESELIEVIQRVVEEITSRAGPSQPLLSSDSSTVWTLDKAFRIHLSLVTVDDYEKKCIYLFERNVLHTAYRPSILESRSSSFYS